MIATYFPLGGRELIRLSFCKIKIRETFLEIITQKSQLMCITNVKVFVKMQETRLGNNLNETRGS